MLGPHLIATAVQMAPEIGRWPRRQPGRLIVGDTVFKYADLHSFYHQVRQIFGDSLYAFAGDAADPLILDCGAHIGLASLFFKEQHPRARIKAFEADAAIAAMCADNLAACGHADVTVVASAVWTHGDGVSFSASADDAGHVSGAGDIRVASIRLRDVIAEAPVTLLKLDIEGAEYAVLADCGDALSGVARLIVEVHAFDSARNSVGSLLTLLEAQGFRYVLSDLHHATWMDGAPTPFAFARNDKYYFTVFAWRD